MKQKQSRHARLREQHKIRINRTIFTEKTHPELYALFVQSIKEFEEERARLRGR